ncbi:hypothetical protein FLONG3_555 [Fusarium longipes]|uniref:Uncharacterized protein n=1 Tax=Fusarium longipes TaxID=694270 RepID=A0A395T9K6_9HYPO|nr:hypothetical protein FLONG3_555 [Fusarium longipes]
MTVVHVPHTSNIRDFISKIEVSYSADQPSDCVSEIFGRSADINKGQGGEYVWLKVHYATKPIDLVSNIWFERCDRKIEGLDDLAKGAGGQYRYLHIKNDMSQPRYVTEVALFRDDSRHDGVPEGWDGMTTDINAGRKGDFLYLLWKTKEYVGPKHD